MDNVRFLSAILTCTVCVTAVAVQNRQRAKLDDGRQWMGSTTAITADAPPIIRGAVAAAFNDVAIAERLLQSVIRTDSRSEVASQAHELLSRIYLRSGQYARLFSNLDVWAASFPGRQEVREEQKDIELFRGLPDQLNGQRQTARLSHDKGDDFSAPVSINGKSARYLLDTGAWVSVLTEAEAVRLGLEIRSGAGTVGDASGQGVKARTAVAPRMTIGPIEFRDVSFIVIPSKDAGGILGMPILLALERLRWSDDGTLEVGGPGVSGDRAVRNLVFFENHLLLTARVANARVFGMLDTGAVGTDLNTNFADQFAELIKLGTKERREITGLGGTVSVDAVGLRELAFDIGGRSVRLRPAYVTLQRNASLGGECCIGNIGRDLLLQTGRFTLDFGAMTLRLD